MEPKQKRDLVIFCGIMGICLSAAIGPLGYYYGFVLTPTVNPDNNRNEIQETFRISVIEHPESAFQGERVEFMIYARSRSAFNNPLLTIQSNLAMNAVYGNFYWYRELDLVYAAAEIDFSFNFTRVFSTVGIWTIEINQHTTSITIV
jgi:hypothetical protein